MAKQYNWTTGPINSSLGYDSTYIVILNNTSSTQDVSIRFYDLSFTPKKLIDNQQLTLKAFETKTVDTRYPDVYRSGWEVQAATYSLSVRLYVSGRRLNSNLPGNTVLNQEFIRY